MTLISRLLVSTVAAAALAGCAGTNFKRPDAQALALGKSTSADVVRVMGSPSGTGEALKNEQKVSLMRYAYAEGAGTGLYPGVVPARAMTFMTFNDVLVGQEFVSSFPQDGTDFNEAKMTSITKGKSTRSDVISLLGAPSGEAIYPIIKKQGDTALLYTYGQAKGSVFDMKFFSKSLVVSIGPDQVVTDVEYSSSGNK